MLLNMLAVSAENALKGYPKNIGIGEAAIYALLGFLVVVAGIALLIFVSTCLLSVCRNAVQLYAEHVSCGLN